MDPPATAHNKSGKTTYSVLDLSDEEIAEAFFHLMPTLSIPVHNIIGDSPCAVPPQEDGRISIKQKKFYAYHIVCIYYWGREKFQELFPNKTSRDALCISHRCGIYPNCCNILHMALEPKWLNDERTHCQFCLKNVFLENTLDPNAISMALAMGVCRHEPHFCCTKVNFTPTQ